MAYGVDEFGVRLREKLAPFVLTAKDPKFERLTMTSHWMSRMWHKVLWEIYIDDLTLEVSFLGAWGRNGSKSRQTGGFFLGVDSMWRTRGYTRDKYPCGLWRPTCLVTNSRWVSMNSDSPSMVAMFLARTVSYDSLFV